MDLRRTGLAALFFLTSVAAATAQDAAGVPSEPAGQTRSAPASAAIDVSRLPLDLERIHRQLRQTTIQEDINGMRIRYAIDVYGRAPAIEFFTKQDNLQRGPVPFGAPTHSDILQAITPQEYRAPVADFGALSRWFADKAKGKK